MLACQLCATHRGPLAPADPPCARAFEDIVGLLQAARKREALARAALIRCEHMRSEALKLVERSRHLSRAAGPEGGSEPGATCRESAPAAPRPCS
jgi:hypothetical protein